MVLILGGYASGKRAFARSLGFCNEDMSMDVFDDKPVLFGLETIVRSDPDTAETLVTPLLQKKLVLCCEVGSGVVPLDPKDRAYREAVGRLCCKLAKEASAVVRVVAGIPTVIKGELVCMYD